MEVTVMASRRYELPRWNDGAKVHWYGERGIVNAIVTHLAAAPDFHAEVKELLRAIVWADRGTPAWIASITGVRLIVEISLADFGNPDLMIVCDVGAERPYLVFVEAKARPYEFSCTPNTNNRDAGFNSTINGQLALKYRFARALEASKSDMSEIAEPEELHKQYGERRRRHLVKGEVRDVLAAYGLVGLPEGRCYYVAFTWDDGPTRVFDAPVETRPCFLANDGSPLLGTMADRYGWLGYGNLEEHLGLGAEYGNACHGMLRQPVPTKGDYAKWRTTPELGPEDTALVKQIEAGLLQACSGQRTATSRSERSISIECNDQVIAKIWLTEPLFVGVRDAPQQTVDHQRFSVNRSMNGVTFYGFALDLRQAELNTNQELQDLVDTVSRLYGAAE
jgi:hypothetical protein